VISGHKRNAPNRWKSNFYLPRQAEHGGEIEDKVERIEKRRLSDVSAPMGIPSTPDHREFLLRPYFGSLDGLRGVSILGVLWHHGPGIVSGTPLARSGMMGVELFFAISGFLITALLLRERDTIGYLSLPKFYARRSLRIFPLYYTVLIIYTALWLLASGHSSREQAFGSHLPAFLTYTANWFVPRTAIFGFAWSLSTEEQFYSVWPSVEKFMKGAAIWVMFAVIAVSQAIQLGWFVTVAPGSLAHRMIAEISLPICFGVLLAHLLHTPSGYRVATTFVGRRWASMAAVLLVLGLLAAGVPRTWTQVAMVLLVAACVIREDHWLRPILGNSLVRHIGVVSYGMYLMHGLVYNLVERVPGVPVHSVSQFGLCVLLTLGVATISYRYYEGLFLRLKGRFSGRPVVKLSP
jgi:peptidoglycan/LPS O-acetylase OafA/YrhL